MVAIRSAKPGDCEDICGLMRELAVYERLEGAFKTTPAKVKADLFGSSPAGEAILGELDGKPVGFALFYQNYSTFRPSRGIYLEDLFVQPQARGKGVGKALLRTIARTAVARGCGHVEWSVLDWNRPSIEFYKSLGAEPKDEWTVFRLEGEPLASFGKTEARRLPTLETERLRLRALEPDDAQELQKQINDPEISGNTMGIPFPYTLEMAQQWIEEWPFRNNSLDWAIELISSGKLIGSVGVGFRLARHRATGGYWIGREHWNKGYASEALRESIRFAFQHCDAIRFHAMHFPHNLASGRVMSKAGLKYEGLLRSYEQVDGKAADVVMYGSPRDEWLAENT